MRICGRELRAPVGVQCERDGIVLGDPAVERTIGVTEGGYLSAMVGTGIRTGAIVPTTARGYLRPCGGLPRLAYECTDLHAGSPREYCGSEPVPCNALGRHGLTGESLPRLCCRHATPSRRRSRSARRAPGTVRLRDRKARGRRMEPSTPREWTPVLDVHPTALRPDCITGYAWLRFPDQVREVHRTFLEFWYDPPGCALTDEELALLKRIAAADEPVMFQAKGRTTPAEHAFDHQVDTLRDLRKAGWIVLETWLAEKGQRGHARRRYIAAQATLTPPGRETLELMGG
jgi:hypothetical protein